MWNRIDLKARGKASFMKNYLPAVAVAFLMGLISMAFSGNSNVVNLSGETNDVLAPYFYSEFSFIASIVIMAMILLSIFLLLLIIFVEYALQIGGKLFFIQNQTTNPGVDTLLFGFRSGHYGNIITTMLIKDVKVFLWTLLLVVPGIVKSYEYMMVPYILAENPGMNRDDVFQISREMMDGNKWNAFVLDLSFIGWQLLSVFTCGLLNIFFVNPYIEATHAEVYSFNKQMAFEKGYIK